MPPFTSASASGGSPFENVATTWPLPIDAPQSFTTMIDSGVGHEVACAKLLTRPVCVGTRCDGVHVALSLGLMLLVVMRPELLVTPPGCSTISVTFTLRTAAAEN